MSLAFEAPLFKTIFTRRTRRFPLGGRLSSRRAGLQYNSNEKPIPLTELETAMLCFCTSGITGVTVEEIRHLLGHLTVLGRTAASPCASLTLHLFFTNDNGVFYYKAHSSDLVIPRDKVRIRTLNDRKKILEDYKANVVKLKDGRIDIPRDAIGSAFESMVNLPGTTLFFPVADTTREYINLLFTGLAQFKWQLWDEVADQPAGVEKWIENGFLDGPKMTIAQYEAMLPWLCNLEAGMAMQNLSLAATAMGLGAFMMHTIDLMTVMKAMNMRFEEPRGEAFPRATLNPVGIEGILEGYCPPYRDPERAVDEIAEIKWGKNGIYAKKGYNLPTPKMYESIVEATKSYCRYIYVRYGRMPKYENAMFIPILAQIHHLDLDFYEQYFPEYLEEADRAHMLVWH
ncbi:MAG: nitroreductase family protein [Spirochaetota bacterium]|nr:MAG: nitroreductase family protein [Spirochaetota bacterium]